MEECGKNEKKMVSFNPYELRLPSLPGEKAHLIGSKCQKCGVLYLGKSRFCRKCCSPYILETVLEQRGKLISYTIIHVPPSPLWRGPLPYAVGRVEVRGGAEVTSQIINCDFLNLKIGMQMNLVVEKAEQDQEGNDVMVYKWSPI